MVKGLFKNSLALSLCGEPKRREYFFKSLMALKRNQKRRKMKNGKEVSGVDIIGYEITDYRQRRAIIRLRGGATLQASFVEFPRAEQRRAIRCFNATRQVSHQSIVSPIFLCYSKDRERMLLFYEAVTFLDDWEGGDAGWWLQNTLEQIRVTKYLQDKGFVHTGLNDPRNFAIQDNKLKMLNVTSSLHEYLQTHPDSNEETVKKDNFKSLWQLMRLRNQEINVLTGVAEAFSNLFNRDDLDYNDWVHKLITHPYGMNSRKYILCFQRIHLANERRYLEKNLREVTGGQQFEQYKNWIQTIQSKNVHHLKEALQSRKGRYEDRDIISLIVFLRNIGLHKHGVPADGLTYEEIAKYYDELVAEIEEVFPGLLTLLLEQIKVKPKYYWLFSF